MSAKPKRLVVALGGNAISAPDRQGTIGEQFAQTGKTAKLLCDAIVDGYQLVLTHGNGPQVGNVLRRGRDCEDRTLPNPAGGLRCRHAGRHGLYDCPVFDE